MGSNPTGPTESSVQILSKGKDKNVRQTDFLERTKSKDLKAGSVQSIGTNSHEMRDLYHRYEKLAYWIKRVNNDLEEPDRTDVLKLVEHMQDSERAILWITRCITAILLIRKQLGKPFKNATKDDINRRYIHLSGKDVDKTLLAINEGEQVKATKRHGMNRRR